MGIDLRRTCIANVYVHMDFGSFLSEAGFSPVVMCTVYSDRLIIYSMQQLPLPPRLLFTLQTHDRSCNLDGVLPVAQEHNMLTLPTTSCSVILYYNG